MDDRLPTRAASAAAMMLDEWPGHRLANVDGATARFSGTTVHFRSPCTAAEGRTCQIVRYLAAWNEFLSQAHLELSELPTVRWELRLASFDGPHPVDTWQDQLHETATLVYWLLKTHRCVTALEVGPYRLREYEAVLCRCLQERSSVKYLKFRFPRFQTHTMLCELVTSMESLSEFECTAAEECSEPFLDVLTALLSTTTSLTVLRIPELRMKAQDAEKFLTALQANSTLKELSLHDSFTNDACRVAFAEYLKSCPTLKTLNIVASSGQAHESLLSILESLLTNKTLCDLRLTGFVFEKRAIQLLTKILTENDVIRGLSVVSALSDAETETERVMAGFLLALGKNDTIRTVRFPYRMFKPELWRQFLTLLPTKSSTQKVTVELDTTDSDRLCEIYETLKDIIPGERVFTANCHVCCVFYFCQCSGYSQFSACLRSGTEDKFSRALQRLSSFSHVTSAHLDIWAAVLEDRHCSAIARYIETTTTLRELHLISWCHNFFSDARTERWRDIVHSLSRNASLEELRLRAVCMHLEDVELLANVIRSSQRLHTVHFIPERTSCAATFLRALSAGLAYNYTLISFTLHWGVNSDMARDWLAVSSAAARNSGLLTRAARFVAGARNDRECAKSLELIGRHPALLRKVVEVASVSQPDAAVLLREGLKSLEGLHEFMRLTGVVKERVVCESKVERRLQLDDLDEQCWSKVRRYLTFGDIKDSVIAVSDR
ncbi:uncharacterized protein LOC144102087 [Amblyomma americanum]